MAIKSRVVLPYLVPQLTAPPANTKALSILASVAGDALNKYLPRILLALQAALATSKGTPEEAQVCFFDGLSSKSCISQIKHNCYFLS